ARLDVFPLGRNPPRQPRRRVEFGRGQSSRRFDRRQPSRQLTARQHRHPIKRVQISAGLVLKRILEGDELVALALQLLKYLVSLNHCTLSTLPSLRAYVSFPAAFPQHFSVKN